MDVRHKSWKIRDPMVRLLRSGTGIGAAYGTAKSGIGIAGVGTFRSDLIMKVRGKEDHEWDNG